MRISTLLTSSIPFGHNFFNRRALASSSLAFRFRTMADSSEDSLRKALSEKQSEVESQGNQVRALKEAGAAKTELDAAVRALNALKLEKTSIEKNLQATISCPDGSSVNKEAFRQAVVNTLERRLFYIPSFKIYGGVAGLYDYGPPGCSVKSNVLGFWRQV